MKRLTKSADTCSDALCAAPSTSSRKTSSITTRHVTTAKLVREKDTLNQQGKIVKLVLAGGVASARISAPTGENGVTTLRNILSRTAKP
jgi:hypothetical protein